MFGDGFFWGAGNASIAIEGAGRRSDWHRWESKGKAGDSGRGNDFRNRYVDDFALFAVHGLRQVRLTLEWARIEPFPGRLDHEELEHVESVLVAARDAGLAVWATLHHGSLPGWFSEDGDGFCTTSGPSIHWSRHVDSMAERFDPLVSVWWPMDDPIGWAVSSYARGLRPPGISSPEKRHDAVYGVLDALFDAHRLLASGENPVVASFGLPSIHASGGESTVEAKVWDDVFWSSWMKAIGEGVLDLPWSAPVERPHMLDAFDAIGLAVRSPIAVSPNATFDSWPIDARRDESGATPSPDDLARAVERVGDVLRDKDLFISQLGVQTEDDRWRAELFERWLDRIAQARADGFAIRGAFLEPAIDGYAVEVGRHLDSGVFSRSREPKPSLGWIEAQQ